MDSNIYHINFKQTDFGLTDLESRQTITELTNKFNNLDSITSETLSKIMSESSENFNTFKEMSDWISSHENNAIDMNYAIMTNSSDISKYNVYSTNEVEIGTWVNGLKLYRKCITFTLTESASIDFVIDYKEIVNVDGCVYLVDDLLYYPLSKSDNDDLGYQIEYSFDRQKLDVNIGSLNAGRPFKFNIIVEYTKIDTQYTLDFNANGGSGSQSSLTSSDNFIVVPTCNYTKYGYVFDYWYYTQDNTIIKVYPGDIIELTSNLTLLPHWSVHIAPGTYLPSSFESLINNYISLNGSRTVNRSFTATVNDQTIIVNAGDRIYYSNSYEGTNTVHFTEKNPVSISGVASSFTDYKTYVTSSTNAFKTYSKYNITIGGSGIVFN